MKLKRIANLIMKSILSFLSVGRHVPSPIKKCQKKFLLSLFEAARWAPSGSNNQPWRFIVARTPEQLAKFHDFIVPVNRVWCEKAPVLTLVISHTKTPKGTDNPSHAFDAGTAWGYLALEANNQGLITHAMGGFEREKAREALHIPAEYELHAVVAIGYRGPVEALPENLQEREVPSGRREIKELIICRAIRVIVVCSNKKNTSSL